MYVYSAKESQRFDFRSIKLLPSLVFSERFLASNRKRAGFRSMPHIVMSGAPTFFILVQRTSLNQCGASNVCEFYLICLHLNLKSLSLIHDNSS